MKRALIVASVILSLLVAGCAPRDILSAGKRNNTPAAGATPTGPTGPVCAELIARAMTSPGVVVTGAAACLNQSAVDEMAHWSTPVNATDQALADYAAVAPVFNRLTFTGLSNGGSIAVYRIGDGTTHELCLGLLMAGPAVSPDTRHIDLIYFAPLSTGYCG